ncbi:MAG: isoprenylcysteine carboxylmethyltransferase family protein [Xanthomonadales bacterium]|nr:isoprenylcysteine carboxylmethyltransferase family protein [Xanthomonadales bacterium]
MQPRVPPPLVALAIAVSMALVARYAPVGAFAFDAQRVLAIAVGVAAFALMSLAAWQFARARTTVNPLHPERSSALVTSGVFARSRNPMYLAMLVLLVAVGLWFGNLLAFALCPLFVLWINRFQIAPEEAALTRLFGELFIAYCSRVRRWI